MAADTWLKLHTSLLTSAKFCSLPSNEHRWAFICLLLLAKKGLESAPERLTLGHLFMSKKRWKTIRADLIEAGLLDASGSVNGFEDSQLSFNALRQRRYKERHRCVTNGVTSNAKKVTDAEAEAEKKKNKIPTARKSSLAAVTTATQVIGMVNDKFGLERGATPTLIRAVEILFRAGHTHDDILTVVEHRLANEEWFDPKKHGAESLIRRDKFPSMLQVAKDAPRRSDELNFEPEPWRN